MIKRILAFTAIFLFTAMAHAQHSASLSWVPSTSTVVSQAVSRGTTTGGPYTPLAAALAPTTTSYVDSTVAAGTTYYYVVTATDGNGNVSLNSNEAVAVIPGAQPPPPPPPTNSSYTRYGTSVSYTDPSGNVWKSGTCPGSTANVTHTISNTTTQPLYQAECYGKTFSIKVTGLTASASYTMTGKFAETYWSSAGSRVFSISVNGTPWLTSFDIFKDAGGEFIADDKILIVTADTTGAVTLAFTTATDNAKIDALSFVPSGPPPPPITLSMNCTSNPFAACTLSETNIPSGTVGSVVVTIDGKTATAPVTVP